MLGLYDFTTLMDDKPKDKSYKSKAERGAEIKAAAAKKAAAKAAADAKEVAAKAAAAAISKADADKAAVVAKEAAAKAAAEKIYAVNNAIIADKTKKEQADSDAARQEFTKAYESGDTQAISVAQTQAQTADINLESSIRNAVSEQKAEGQVIREEDARQQIAIYKERQDISNSIITRVNYSATMNYLNQGDIWQPNNTYNLFIFEKPAKHFNTVNDAVNECDSFPECTSVSCDDATMNCSLNKMPTDVYAISDNDYGGYTTYSK